MPTIAILGATGGTANALLIAALLCPSPIYTIRALARTPSKLLDPLTSKPLIPSSALSRLTIIPGDAHDISAVTTLLTTSDEEGRDGLVDVVVFAIGAYPSFRWSLSSPIYFPAGAVCETGMRVLLSALGSSFSQQKAKKKPRVLAISTTGVTREGMPGDVPTLLYPLYHWALEVPHRDKKAMEALLWEDMEREEGERRTGGFVIVRPTLLTDGEVRGVEAVRWGGEREPAVGWSVGRKDVGGWMFEMGVKGSEEVGRDVAVSLTY